MHKVWKTQVWWDGLARWNWLADGRIKNRFRSGEKKKRNSFHGTLTRQVSPVRQFVLFNIILFWVFIFSFPFLQPFCFFFRFIRFFFGSFVVIVLYPEVILVYIIFDGRMSYGWRPATASAWIAQAIFCCKWIKDKNYAPKARKNVIL